MNVLLTGATGYVGGRLRRRLEELGVSLRCLVRDPGRLAGRVAPATELVAGDVLDPEGLERAMRGVDVAYYLVHSMGGPHDYEERDRMAARGFASAASRAGVRRIVYLGGLGQGPDLSAHLASRQEVGRILRESDVPTIELRSSIILGSGSLSFELIRALVERLPIMTTPRWVATRTQPIAIDDVLGYLVAAAGTELPASEVVEIGGPDRVSYGDLMREYARQRGLRRRFIPLPVLSPRISSLWLGLITPIYARIGRELIDGVRNETIVQDPQPAEKFRVRPRGMAEAIAGALANEDQRLAETRWSDALSSKRSSVRARDEGFGPRIVDSRTAHVAADEAGAFAPIGRIGGDAGWYWGDWLWKMRGFLDLLVGGVGARRGRRDPERLTPGDAVDFWRVEAIEPDRMLRLRAEMKMPGRAWLQFEVEPNGRGSVVRQTVVFDPCGVAGLAYWYALYPLHKLVFSGMLRGIAMHSEGASP